MTLDDKDILRLKRNGTKVLAADGKPLRTAEPRPGRTEANYLRDISTTLQAILQRPERASVAPLVTVEPPLVTVNSAPPIRKWKFELTKNEYGETMEITATAIE